MKGEKIFFFIIYGLLYFYILYYICVYISIYDLYVNIKKSVCLIFCKFFLFGFDEVEF